MITMKNFRVLVPEKKDALLGYTGENLSRRLTIAVDDPGPWSYKLDIRNDAGVANIMDMTAGDGVIYVDIERAALQVSGRVQAQVRAINGDAVKCSNIFSLFIGDSVQAVNYFESLPPSEFEQLEANLTAIKSEAQASARKAKESENNAKAYAEGGTVQKTTYDESGNLTGFTATEVTGAKGYQENAAGSATRSAQAMMRAAAYAEGGTVPAALIGNVAYPAIDTIGAKGYMEQAQEAADRAEGAAERAEAAGGSGSGGGEGTPGGYYTPTVRQPDANTMRVSYTPSQEGMAGVEQVDVVLPKGDSGKTAYQYAQDGGYTGSETEFAAKLAAEHLPVPATAAVGQYFRAKTVDENGLVTEVEAVDAPTGGGGGKLLIDYVHDDDKLAYVIQIAGYDADTGVWTTDGAIDLTTVTFEPFSQISLKDPLAKIGPENQSSLLGQTLGRVTVTGTNTFTFSSNPNTTEFTPEDYVLIPNVKVTFASIPSTVKRMRMVLEGQFLAGTRYCTFGWNKWFDPNGQTTVAAEKKYRAGKAIYSVIVSDFYIENGYIRGTTKQIYFDTGAIGSAEGIYFPTAGDSFPDMVFSEYAHAGYNAMPYKGRVRLYDMEDTPWVF